MPADNTATLLAAASKALQAARVTLNKRIGSYPAPIPACDAQFNGLLDQRRRLSRAIRDIEDILASGATEPLSGMALQKIAEALGQVDDTLAARLKATLTRDSDPSPTAR